MARTQNVGTCLSCQKTVSHQAITRHLEQCVKPPQMDPLTKNKPVDIYRIKLFAKPFWLYCDMPAKATLNDLDDFLRATWLECCGHLSAFTIHGQCYENSDRPISQVLAKEMSFGYEYDFGSTTELEGKVIAVYQGHLNKKVHLLARNNLPIIECGTCASLAEVICSMCFDVCCKKCRKKHRCGDDDDFMLPVVNSPRMGVCGYTGEEEDFQD